MHTVWALLVILSIWMGAGTTCMASRPERQCWCVRMVLWDGALKARRDCRSKHLQRCWIISLAVYHILQCDRSSLNIEGLLPGQLRLVKVLFFCAIVL